MKVQGFAEALGELYGVRRTVPYAWGTQDCVMWAADAALAVSGDDPLGDLRGAWSSEAEAMTVLEAQGGLIAAMDARYPRKDKNFAQRGDIALIKDAQGQPSLGVCVGQFAAAPGPEEMLLTPMTKARIVWEV